MQRYCLLTPVLDDWASLAQLVADLGTIMDPAELRLDIIAVDDGSTLPIGVICAPSLPPNQCIERISVIRLASNLGHQRAIAVGLSSVATRDDIDGVIVMDSDGEDRPVDIPRLVTEAKAHPGQVVFAHRATRSEGAVFRAGYQVYKAMFRLMTGKEISFGNFCVLPMNAVRRLVHMAELWNNLPAAIIRSRLPFRKIATARGVRYAGVSRMNFAGLVVHGLSAMSVYADILFVRILMAAAAVCGLSVFMMIVVVVVRLGTDLAIPGWATTAFGNLLVILFQALVIIVATTLMVLASRTSRPFVPIADTGIFVTETITLAQTDLRQLHPAG